MGYAGAIDQARHFHQTGTFKVTPEILQVPSSNPFKLQQDTQSISQTSTVKLLHSRSGYLSEENLAAIYNYNGTGQNSTNNLR